MEPFIQYERLYADSSGETHFEPFRIALGSARFTPPAPPLDVSELARATRHGFLRLAPGWVGDWHRSPQCQWLFFLTGEVIVEASDGAVRRYTAGGALRLEDVDGRGHRSRVVGDVAAVMAAVQW